MIRRHRHGIAAAILLAAALALTALSGELIRWQRQLDRSDALFQVTPARAGLWQVPGAPSWDPAKAILGIDHDLEWRKALRLAWLAKGPAWTVIPPPRVPRNPASRVEAELALARISETDPDRRRRSQALNLLTVLRLTGATQTGPELQSLRETVGDLQRAIVLDPDNDDAKVNLELVLQASGQALAPPEDVASSHARPGRSNPGGRGASAPGTGY